MNLNSVAQVADAVLYEGYSLYPYRADALKNRQRWHFGVLYPREFCERADANDAWMMQTECLVLARGDASLSVCVRFLALSPGACAASENTVPECSLQTLLNSSTTHRIETATIRANVEISASAPAANLCKVSVRITNDAPFEGAEREKALAFSLVSTHAILVLQHAEFVSSIDPPADLQQLSAQCKNSGLWPVLAGAENQRAIMLAAPIILYDYPKVAAQSRGDHFDCTEIDEMLALRIDTLTADEKARMSADPRTAEMLERTHALSREQLGSLHAKMELTEGGALPRKGQRVRLKPQGRADIFDLVLDGKIAIVESLEVNLEDELYVTVTIEDDPGRDLGVQGKHGHRFFFRLSELEAP